VANPGSEVSVAAKRYAQAAFDLAVESGDTRAWELALGMIAGFMADAEVKRVLENGRVTQEAKQHLIEAALGDLPKLPLNLARLLVRKGRTGLAPEIEEYFKRLVEQREGIARVTARTAVPLSDAEQEALSQAISRQTGQRVILDTQVDPALLGGVVVQIGDRLVDGSVKGRLEELRERLVGSV
jgi:F-type H+-transporting ATPase subunit delta